MPHNRILIDLNSVSHAAHQGTTLRAGDQETQAVYGTLQFIRKLRVAHPKSTLICLHDGKSWRKAVSERYKANRLDDPKKRAERKKYTSQMPFTRKALSHLGISQIAASNLEADDLAALLTRKYVAAGDTVELITGDRDWLQLIDVGVTWRDHRDDSKRFSLASFEAATGYKTVEQFVQSKALEGDTSDNLQGVGGIGAHRAAVLLKIWPSVEAFLSDPDPKVAYLTRHPLGGSFPKAFEAFHTDPEKIARFHANFYLMNLRGDLPKPIDLKHSKGLVDTAGFEAICYELGFASIYRPEAFDAWVRPFIQKE